jgi:hypothetical protein
MGEGGKGDEAINRKIILINEHSLRLFIFTFNLKS